MPGALLPQAHCALETVKSQLPNRNSCRQSSFRPRYLRRVCQFSILCLAYGEGRLKSLRSFQPHGDVVRVDCRERAFALTSRQADIRRDIRQARAKPFLDELRIWLEKPLRSLSAKGDTAAAIRYALSRWRALPSYSDDGRLEIDNNATGRALRTVALGRKNYLFSGPDCGSERAAAMY
jgi:hypothetical protein